MWLYNDILAFNEDEILFQKMGMKLKVFLYLFIYLLSLLPPPAHHHLIVGIIFMIITFLQNRNHIQ